MTLRMKCIVAVTLALAGGCKPSVHDGGWHVVSNNNPQFSVEMPGQPKATADVAGGGSLSLRDGAEDVYVVTWSRVDARWLVRENQTALDGGRVISDNRISEHERVSIVELDRGGIQVERLVVVGDLGYKVSAISREQRSGKRFADSFNPRAPTK